MFESELRSILTLNEHLHTVLSFFHPTPHVQKEIIYFGKARYVDGTIQSKTVLRRTPRSFLPGVKTDYVESVEGPAHRSYARHLQAQPGRLAALRLSQLAEGTRKCCFQISEHLSVRVYLFLRHDRKPLTRVVCEVEHPQCGDWDFLFRHPVGLPYQDLLVRLWTRFQTTLLVLARVPDPLTHGLSHLTQPRHPTCPEPLLTSYDLYLKKLDGIPGTLTFHADGQRIALANERSIGRPACQQHLAYPWTDHLLIRVEWMEESRDMVVTDIYRGSFGEILSQLPYMYRYTYLRYLCGCVPLPLNEPRLPTVPLDDPSLSDGILLLEAYTLSPPCKLKYHYTVDLVYGGQGMFMSQENTVYVAHPDTSPLSPYVPGTIYECRMTADHLLVPVKRRSDKHRADTDRTVTECQQTLNRAWTISHIWPQRQQVGVKEACCLPPVSYE